jgi:flagellar motor switch protein FliM
MAGDFLSQDEVDALLKGVTGEADEPEESEGDGGGVRAYNIGTQERIVRGRMPTLELVNERFARYLRIGLFNYMHRNAEISVGPIRVQKYSEFIRNLVVPTNLNLVIAKPLRGTALFVFDPNLVFLVVDNMFGGDGRFHTRVEGRDFTPTEQRIIQGLLNVVFTEYSKSWKPVYDINFEYIRSEMNSQFANIATPSEIVVSTTFTLEFGGATADMHICFPYSMLEPIRDLLYSTMQSDQLSSDKRWIGTLRKQLQGAEVEIVAQLGSGKITLGQILKLKVGDVVPLHIPEKIEAMVDGVPLIECTFGQQSGQYALKVERFIAASPETPHTDAAPGEKMADEMENMANDVAADEDQISEDDWAAAMAEQAVTEPSSGQAAQPADIFPSFGGNAGSAGMMNELDMILDIPVQITVELGRTKITIKNLLQLAHGSVVELEAMAGEPMDVMVNGTLIAQGEVVVVNDKFGIRLTDIITPSERMRKLNR